MKTHTINDPLHVYDVSFNFTMGVASPSQDRIVDLATRLTYWTMQWQDLIFVLDDMAI
jgi:hypothetical protein